MEKRPPRVWIDDHHPIFRRGLAACLEGSPFSIAGESAGLKPGPEPGAADIVIFEADNGGLRRALPLSSSNGTRTVAVMRDPGDHTLLEAIEAGTSAVLIRGKINPDGLVVTLRSVADGNTTLPTELVPRLLEQTSAQETTNGNHRLTPREINVLQLLATGEDTRGIAGELSYSDRTVKNIVHDVLMKLNCRNRAHAVALATRQGLI